MYEDFKEFILSPRQYDENGNVIEEGINAEENFSASNDEDLEVLGASTARSMYLEEEMNR